MVGAAVKTVPEKFVDRQAAALAGDDRCLVGEQRGRHGRGMRRHARTEVEGDAVEMIAGAGGTVGPAFLQAVDVRIAKIPATRALREIAAERGDMADLRRRETLRGGGKRGPALRDAGVEIPYPQRVVHLKGAMPSGTAATS